MMLLAKIQDEQYIEDMYQKEYLYFKGLKDFRSNLNDSTGRLDPRELNIKNLQFTSLSIKTKTAEIELSNVFSNFSGQFMEHPDDPKINCCSLYTIDIDLEGSLSKINDRALDMGNKMLLIFDCKAFFKILDDSIVKSGYEYSRRPVIYYNPKTHNGDLTFHHKENSYDFQEEYRILIQPTNSQPVKIKLPGLKNISAVIDSKSVRTIKIQLNPTKPIR